MGEKECGELQKSEKNARNKIRELMDEIASISKKNTDLMSYCERKVAFCRVEYERVSKKCFVAKQTTAKLKKEMVDLNEQLSQNGKFKNECTRLRANISTLKSQIKEHGKVTAAYKKEVKSMRDLIDGKKHRLNETSKHFNKINEELIWYKHENKTIRTDAVENEEKIKELELCNAELIEENEEIKKQISRFSVQLQQQSIIQNEIIGIQQQLTKKKHASVNEDDLKDTQESKRESNEEQTDASI